MTPRDIADRLPSPDDLEVLSIAIAALDSVLSPDWEERVFSYDPDWDDEERLASMSDGSGDEYHVLFSPAGTVVRVFDHESSLSPWTTDGGELAPGLLDGYPDELRPFIDEPAFQTEDGPPSEITFCAWHLPGGDGWEVGSLEDDGGATDLLDVVLDGTAEGYRTYAEDYFEVAVPIEVVQAFYELRPADVELVESVDPAVEIDVDGAIDELDAIGYPIAEDD